MCSRQPCRSEHSSLLENLTDLLRRRAKDWQPCELHTLVEPPPRVRHGGEHVYLLFGPRVIFLDESNELQVDIGGLVFENITRVSREINLREDLPEIQHLL